MKLHSIFGWTAGVAVATAALVVCPSSASAVASDKDKAFTGIIKYVNQTEHSITVKGWIRHRTFELGKDCSITLWNNTTGPVENLARGQKVTVSYQNVHGVLAADGVKQQPMRYTGIVKYMDPESQQLVLHKFGHDKKFALAGDCKVVLYQEKTGSVTNIQPGDHITVVYEKPGHEDVVRQIAQTGISFTGAITAVDVRLRTVTAQGAYGSRQFTLAKDCSIVMQGRIDAPMMDLQPGQRLTIDYDEVNGVDVATRIGLASHAAENNVNVNANAQANR